jgi:hypothetical protein
MANQVTYANLFSESRNNVVALLNSANVPDPTISTAEFRKWIYSREPDMKASDFSGYPIIIVHPADFDVDKDKGSLDMKSKEVLWDIEIEIITSDRGYGANDGKGLSYMDTISNNILKTFLDKSNRITLSNNSMKFTNPTTTSVGSEVIENELVYRRTIILSFKSRIQVSA